MFTVCYVSTGWGGEARHCGWSWYWSSWILCLLQATEDCVNIPGYSEAISSWENTGFIHSPSVCVRCHEATKNGATHWPGSSAFIMWTATEGSNMCLSRKGIFYFYLNFTLVGLWNWILCTGIYYIMHSCSIVSKRSMVCNFCNVKHTNFCMLIFACSIVS